MADSLLFNGYCGTQTLNVINVRPLHQSEELPCVRGKALDVAPLAFGVDGVECQAGLAGAGKSRDDHEFVARYLNINILEVVLPSPFDYEEILVLHSECVEPARSFLPEK